VLEGSAVDEVELLQAPTPYGCYECRGTRVLGADQLLLTIALSDTLPSLLLTRLEGLRRRLRCGAMRLARAGVLGTDDIPCWRVPPMAMFPPPRPSSRTAWRADVVGSWRHGAVPAVPYRLVRRAKRRLPPGSVGPPTTGLGGPGPRVNAIVP